MDRKAAIKQLKKLAQAQHQILEALAQDASEVQMGTAPAPTASSQPAPASLQPQVATKREADTILKSLPPALKASIALLEVKGGSVLLRFQPGKSTQANYDAVMSVVKSLQEKNLLTGSSYNVQLV